MVLCKRLILIVSIMAVMISCSTLKVEVSILDRSVVDELVASDRIKVAIPIIQSERPEDIRRKTENMRQAHFDVYADGAQAAAEDLKKICSATTCDSALTQILKNALLTEVTMDASDYCGQKLCNSAVITLLQVSNDLENGFGPAWEDKYTALELNWEYSNELVLALYSQYVNESPNSVRYDQLSDQLNMALDQRDMTLINFYLRVGADLDPDNESPESASLQTAKKLLGDKSALTRSYETGRAKIVESRKVIQIIDSGGVEHSKYASVIAGIPKHYWKKQFDYAKGNGYFGNVDVAIKALGPTNFTIKGLSFNPADVAMAASKVTTQSVLLAAQIAGVPVNIQGTPPTGNGASLANASSGLSTAMAASVQSEANLKAFDNALSILATTIINEANNINAGRVKESLDVIKVVYDSQSAGINAVSSGGTKP